MPYGTLWGRYTLAVIDFISIASIIQSSLFALNGAFSSMSSWLSSKTYVRIHPSSSALLFALGTNWDSCAYHPAGSLKIWIGSSGSFEERISETVRVSTQPVTEVGELAIPREMRLWTFILTKESI